MLTKKKKAFFLIKKCNYAYRQPILYIQAFLLMYFALENIYVKKTFEFIKIYTLIIHHTVALHHKRPLHIRHVWRTTVDDKQLIVRHEIETHRQSIGGKHAA